jgi:hypothetical protein
MTIFQQYGKRYLCFYTVLALMALFTTTITAAELSGTQSWEHRFEVRLASHEPVKGWGSVSYPTSAETIWISPEITLTNADVVLAELVRMAADKFSVNLMLTEDGSLKFARLTKAHVGGFAAVIIDDRVMMVPKIIAEINNGRINITGDFTEEEARSIAAGIAVRHNSTEENNKKIGMGHQFADR